MAEDHPHARSASEMSIADAFSIANAVCGFFAIALLARGDFGESGLQRHDVIVAGSLLVAAALFDILDGPVAKWRGSSELGETLDTLSDVVTFAVLPAVLLAVAGAAEGSGHPKVLLTAAAAYLVAVLLRLARFSVASAPSERQCFSGMPCPLATLAVFGLVVLDPGAYPTAAGVGLTVVLMVSSVPYPKASRASAPLIAVWAGLGAAGLAGMVPLDLVAAATVIIVLGIPLAAAARLRRDSDLSQPA